MTQDTFRIKSRRYANAVALILAVIVVKFIYDVVSSLRGAAAAELPGEAFLISGSVMSVLAMAVMVLSFRLLVVVSRGPTPFTPENAKRLRTMGWLMIAFEPLQRLLAAISWNRAYDPALAQGEKVVYYFYNSGGMILLAGVAVLCVSLAFQYGAELQRQSDETL